MTSILSIFNQCGGVAKTTLTHNLSYHLSQHKRVLMVDLDPQASLTSFVGLEPKKVAKTSYQALVEGGVLPRQSLLPNLDIIPANIRLSAAEKQLVSEVMREFRLKNALNSLDDHYDFILIDCPPSLGLLSVLALVASTQVLVPIETQSKSFEGTDLLLQTVLDIRKLANPQLDFAGFVPTLYDKRTIHHFDILEAIQKQLHPLGEIFPAIPNSVVFPDASLRRLPLAMYKPKHPAVSLLNQITNTLAQL